MSYICIGNVSIIFQRKGISWVKHRGKYKFPLVYNISMTNGSVRVFKHQRGLSHAGRRYDRHPASCIGEYDYSRIGIWISSICRSLVHLRK